MAEFQQFDFGRLILGLVKHGVLLSISITVVVADSRGQINRCSHFFCCNIQNMLCASPFVHVDIYLSMDTHLCMDIVCM